MLNRLSLTISMLMLTASAGLIVWAISDSYQTSELGEIFRKNLSDRFSDQAREQRLRFDRYVKSYNPGVKMYASHSGLQQYMQQVSWSDGSEIELVIYESVPPWLPKLSVMRRFILPRYAMLIDESGDIRELYRYKYPMPPSELMHIAEHTLKISYDQSYLTLFNNQLYMITSEYIGKQYGKSRILIASPIDEQFLEESQGVSAGNSIIALTKDEETKILVSNNESLIPVGSDLSFLEQGYLLTGEGFFDSGSSDVLLKLISFMSTEEIRQQTESVLIKERQMRAMTAFAYITAFGLVMYWVTSRIQKLNRRVVRFSEDMEIKQPTMKKNNQLEELESRFELLASAIQSETATLEHQALHDPLTGMPNRKLLNDRMQHELIASERTGDHFVFMLSDLDRFKDINDTLGHHIGDLVLQQVSERLRNILRKHDTVARLGGDEFGMLLPTTTVDKSRVITDKILAVFDNPIYVDGYSLDIGLSIGIVEYPMHGDDVNILLQRADVAMYVAKNRKTGFSVYESKEDQNTISRLALMADLKKALENDSLQLYFQPKIDLVTGAIISAEALLRWKHPERGMIPPDEFIPLAEQTGLIEDLTTWVINEAIKQCSYWSREGHQISVSINISVYSLHSHRITETFERVISKYDLHASKVILEVTESLFIRDPARAKKILDSLDKLGVEISIDDFGTGYSSLAYLKILPVSEIKIDRSFVKEMLEDENDEVIVKTTIDLAHNLGIRVVAEGVENSNIISRLKFLGCDVVQGYYLGYPLPAKDFMKTLSTHTEVEIYRCGNDCQ